MNRHCDRDGDKNACFHGVGRGRERGEGGGEGEEGEVKGALDRG